jgi:hypothetical protein
MLNKKGGDFKGDDDSGDDDIISPSPEANTKFQYQVSDMVARPSAHRDL